MSATYELWLLDDRGRNIALLKNYAFFSYSRALNNNSTFQIGFPYDEYVKLVNAPYFSPDWRVDVWRSPQIGIPMRREQMYLLRKYRIYTRESDNVQMIVLYGHDMKDLLERRFIIQPAGYTYCQKEDYIDDMMKEIVREQMLWNYAVDPDGVSDNARAWPPGEFIVQAELSLGPFVAQTFADRNVAEVLQELSGTSKELYAQDPLSYDRIYYNIVPFEVGSLFEWITEEENPAEPIRDETGAPLLAEQLTLGSDETGISSPDDIVLIDSGAKYGFRFETYAGLYGIDRTDGQVYSVENNNLQAPYYSMTHLDEINTVYIKGFGRGDSRPWDEIADSDAVNQSRWNRRESFQDASSEPDQDNLADYGYSTLYNNRAKEEITAVFLNTPGGPDSPRSLYGVDWDLGDLLPVLYAGKSFNVEVVIVYVAVEETGMETITGRNDVESA